MLGSGLPNPARDFGSWQGRSTPTLHQLAHPHLEFDPEGILLTLVEILADISPHAHQLEPR